MSNNMRTTTTTFTKGNSFNHIIWKKNKTGMFTHKNSGINLK